MTYLTHVTPTATSFPPMMSPLMLSDRLLWLAQDADHAGLRATAEHLLDLASQVLDEPPVARV